MQTEKQDPSMIVKLWGVRGSIPSPLTTAQVRAKEEALIQQMLKDNAFEMLRENPDRIKEYLGNLPLSLSGTYGGNTTCVEVQAKDSPLIAIDAGSGARDFGNSLFPRIFQGKNINPLSSDEKTSKLLHWFLTHYHWDHLQGFPFFGPAFLNGANRMDIVFHGKKDAQKTLSRVLAGQQQYPNFPVVLSDMPCEKKYRELGRMENEAIKIGSAEVRYQELSHPDSVFAYRINVNGKSFVCATDTEHPCEPDPRLVRLAKEADILYYDGQYTDDEYIGRGLPMDRIGWGHSTPSQGIKVALASDVKTVALGHYDPPRDDFAIEQMYEKALEFRNEQLKLPQNEGKTLEVIMASEGQELVL